MFHTHHDDLSLYLVLTSPGAQPAVAWFPRAAGQREQGSPGQPALPLRHLPHGERAVLRQDTQEGLLLLVWFILFIFFVIMYFSK